MKNIHHKLLKTINRLLSGLLVLLGFASCGNDTDEIPAMYGTPHVTFYIQGKIQNAAGDGIPDIKLEILSKLSNNNESNIWFNPCSDPILTNTGGNFSISVSAFPTDQIRIVATDIDGTKNGSFAKDSIDVKITDADYTSKGDGAWDMGTARKENILLELKQIDIKNE